MKIIQIFCGWFGHRWRDEKYGMASCGRCHKISNWADIQRDTQCDP